MKLHVSAGTLGFEADGMTLHGGSCGAELLTGTAEKCVEWSPVGKSRTYSSRRHTPGGPVRETSWRWTDSSGWAFTWSVGALEWLPGFTLRAAFHNGGAEAVRLRKIVMCQTGDGGLSCAGDPASWWLSTLVHATEVGHLGEKLRSTNEVIRAMWAGFGMPVPNELPSEERANDGHWRSYSDFLTLYTEGGRRGLAMGAVGAPEADVRFDCRVEDGAMRLDIVSQMSDVRVEPGQTRNAQEVVVLAGDYNSTVDALLRWLAATHGQRTHRGPVFGWCSWYDKWDKVAAEDVTAVADAKRHLGDQMPLQVIQVDDGYQRQVGDWECNSKFPNGWAPVVERIRAAGAKPGVWLAPLAVHDSLGYLETHPDWFQRTADGQLAGEVNNWGASAHWVDPTHPEVQQFLRGIMQRARQAGFEYFKIDFNGVEESTRFHDPSKTRLQVYRDLYRLYRDEVGEDAYLLACASFTRGVVGYADAARIGPDAGPEWEAAHPCCILECIRAVAQNAIGNGIVFFNDPDVTYALPRNKLTEAEWRTWHSFVGLLGGLALVSEPIQQPDYATSLRMIEILNPPGPERGLPFHGGTDRDCRQFGFVAQRSWGSFASLLLWNPLATVGDVPLDGAGLSELGEQFHVWSFWDGAYLGIKGDGYVARDVAPHGPKLLRLTALPADDRIPILIGSNLHISLGAAEIADVASTTTACNIVLTDAGAREGNLFVWSARALSLVGASGCTVAEVSLLEGTENTVWRVSIRERRGGEQQVIRLGVG